MRVAEILLTAGSAGIFLFGLVSFFFLARQRWIGRRLLGLTGAVFAAVFLLEAAAFLAAGRPLFPSTLLIETMQAFSLDSGYDAVSRPLSLFGGGWADRLLRWYRAAAYTAAPVVGGAVIYDVLAGVSPGLRLFFLRRRRLLVFSELNEKSLCLAASVLEAPGEGARPVPVFTGCGGDGPSELTARARTLKAVCLEEALPDCRRLDRSRACSFFLMDGAPDGDFDDDKNLRTLQDLLAARRPLRGRRRSCRIFCFTDRAETAESIRALKADSDRRGAEDVTLHVIRDYAQTAQMLLKEHPLFEALADAEPGRPVRVLIAGDNAFARELFKTVFWCGQMLDHPLQLALVRSPAPGEESFEDRLGRLSPEIAESCTPGADCLRVSLSGETAEPYASLCFAEATAAQMQSMDFLTEPRSFRFGPGEAVPFCDYDRLFLLTGDDGENRELADALWRNLTYLERAGRIRGGRLIAAAVEDEALARVARMRCEKLNGAGNVRMAVFGSLDRRFGRETVFADGAYLAGEARLSPVREARHDLPGLDASRDDLYDDWSRLARSFHLPCKMFVARCLLDAAEDGEIARSAAEKALYCRRLEEDPVLYDRLTWLEHRRWNAFLRTQGFRQPPGLTEILRETEEGRCPGGDWQGLSAYAYKNVPARLHPNLVECAPVRVPGRRDLLDAASAVRDRVDALRPGDGAGPAGNEASAGLRPHRQLQRPPEGIKRFDAPDGDNCPCLDLREAALLLTGRDPGEVGRAELERAFPGLAACENPRLEGRYFADLVLDLKDEARRES